MKILIVDDKKENLYYLESLLKGFGYEVFSAVNGKDALEKLRSDSFNLTISDILMPEMDGYQLLRNVQEDHNLRDMPFVFYTGTYTEDKDKEVGLKLGASEYIQKPIDPEEFIKIIQGIIKDYESGRLKPKKPAIEEKEEVLKLYSERLVLKLEQKTLDLEREITKSKQAEEELIKYREHLEELVKERTQKLEEQNKELARLNHLFVNREFRIKELRDRVKELENKISDNR